MHFLTFDAYQCSNAMIFKIIVSLLIFVQLVHGAEDIHGEDLSVTGTLASCDGDTDELTSLAEHIREDPLIIEQFTPDVSFLLYLD